MFLGFLQCPDTLPEEETKQGFIIERYGILRTVLTSGEFGRTDVSICIRDWSSGLLTQTLRAAAFLGNISCGKYGVLRWLGVWISVSW